jgi:thymidylate synthase ThyX
MESKITLIEYPTEKDWMEVKRRALVTVGKKPVSSPAPEWKKAILEARHSPIRYLRFSFLLENLPTWVSVHLVRHIHAQPYVKSQRNDRQSGYDRNTAPQDAPVSMIWDINAEELMVIANKRLCALAAKETREVVQEMCRQVTAFCPEFDGLLVPMCEYNGGICHEMYGCGRKIKNG